LGHGAKALRRIGAAKGERVAIELHDSLFVTPWPAGAIAAVDMQRQGARRRASQEQRCGQ
jgi:hypothetical protein